MEQGLEQVASALVGRMGMKEAQLRLRKAMLEAALLRTNGSRRATAVLLQVDRAYVRRMMGTLLQD